MSGQAIALDRSFVCWQRFFHRALQHHWLRRATTVVMVVLITSAIHTGRQPQSVIPDHAVSYSGFISRNPTTDASPISAGSKASPSADSYTTSRGADRIELKKPSPTITPGWRSQPSTASARERQSIEHGKKNKPSQKSVTGLRITRRSGAVSFPGDKLSSNSNLVPEIHTTFIRDVAPDIALSSNADYHYRLALDFLKNDQMLPADKQLRMALASDPHHEPARLALAEMLMRQKRIAEAQMIVFEGIAQAKNQLPFVIELAKLYLVKSDVDRARIVLEQYEDASEDDANYFGLLAAVYQRSGKHELALAAFEKAIRGNPQEARWWLGFAISLEKTGKLQKATTAYRRVIESTSATPGILKWVRNRLAILQTFDNQRTTGASHFNLQNSTITAEAAR